MTSGENERTGGVRGAINDLLGLGDRRGERDGDRHETPETAPGPNADQPFSAGDQARESQVQGDQGYAGQTQSDPAYADQSQRGPAYTGQTQSAYAGQTQGDPAYASQTEGDRTFGAQGRGDQTYADQTQGDRAPAGDVQGDPAYADQSQRGPAYAGQTQGDRTYGGQTQGDETYGGQAQGGQTYGDPARSGYASGDQPGGDQRFGDGTPAGATSQRVDDPGAVRTDRFDAQSDAPVAGGSGDAPTGHVGLFDRRDEPGADRTVDPVGTPHDTGMTSTDPQANPDVPAEARLDAPPPGQAGPRHELIGEGEHGRPADEPFDRTTVDDTSGRAAGTVGAAGAVAAADRRAGDHGGVDTVDTTPGQASDPADGAALGRSTPAGAPATADASVGTDEEGRERLVPAERATDYGTRWDHIKGDFVDEPRQAVAGADSLVGELLDELQNLFAEQRQKLDRGFDDDEASTEDLRLALRRYRSFFDRLLSI